jgi:outer membrane receptor protein involved in Fe transport
MKARRRAPSPTRSPQWLLALPFVVSVLLPRLAASQDLTGTLVGTVKDEQSAALTGALVRLTSSALIGGPTTITTNDRGQLRFPVLPPGSYALDVELQGFAPYHEDNIRIGAGATLERTVVLKLAGVAESIVVEGSGSRIEARGSGFETRFGPESLETIPTRRYSMFDFMRAAPGVSATSPSSGSVNTMTTFGSGGNENLFLIDGTNFTCPCAGVSRAEPSVDVIQEIQIQSVGASAEFGNIQGGVFNVITKQGGDRFLYDASYYGQPAVLTSQPVLVSVPGGQERSGYERNEYRDFTTNLGGPVVRNRVWFFTGYQYLRDYDSQPGTNPKFPRTYEQNKIFEKVTWRIKPSLQLVQSLNDEHWLNPQVPTFVTPFEATQRLHAHVPTMTFGNLTHTLSANTVWDVRVGRFVFSQKNDPSTGDFLTPNRFDRVTGVSSGNPPEIGEVTLIRSTVKATLTHYQREWLAADHQWKIGTQVEKGGHDVSQVIPTGTRFVDNNGQPFQAISRDPAISGGQFVTVAAFATDTMTLGDRLTVNAGARYDHNRAYTQDLPVLDVEGRETEGIIHGLGTIYTWNLLSPRLGFTAKLSADGRTILRASYGRFHQGILTAEVAPTHPGITPVTTTAFDPATGDYTHLVSVVDSTRNVQVDHHMRSPLSDEYSIGVDRELSSLLRLAIAYVGKSGSDFIAYTDVGGVYREDVRTLPDGRSLPVSVLVNSTADRRFLLTNPDGYSLTYNGFVMAAEKRRSSGWQALASYTFSTVSGLQVSSGTTAGGAQSSTVAPVAPLSTVFGRDPNDLTNARGRLPNDRPHMLKVMGSVDVPRTGLVVSANLQYLSGKPWAATTQVALPQGDQRILLEPRGSRRLSSQSLLDVRVSKQIVMSRGVGIDLLVDVLNALNDTSEEELATDNLFSPNFGRPIVLMDPRRAMLGVRLNLGR